MKKVIALFAAGALTTLCVAQAQEAPLPELPPVDGGVVDNPPPIDPPPVEEPDVPEIGAPPAVLVALLEAFRAAREEFVASQQELTADVPEGAEELREAIRESIQDNIQSWREAQEEFRDEMRDRAQALKDELQESLPAQVGGVEGGRP